MPVQKCAGGKGKKYGTKGKCYTGKGAHRKAAAQGAAIAHSQRRRGRKVK